MQRKDWKAFEKSQRMRHKKIKINVKLRREKDLTWGLRRELGIKAYHQDWAMQSTNQVKDRERMAVENDILCIRRKIDTKKVKIKNKIQQEI